MRISWWIYIENLYSTNGWGRRVCVCARKWQPKTCLLNLTKNLLIFETNSLRIRICIPKRRDERIYRELNDLGAKNSSFIVNDNRCHRDILTLKIESIYIKRNSPVFIIWIIMQIKYYLYSANFFWNIEWVCKQNERKMNICWHWRCKNDRRRWKAAWKQLTEAKTK